MYLSANKKATTKEKLLMLVQAAKSPHRIRRPGSLITTGPAPVQYNVYMSILDMYKSYLTSYKLH